MEPSPLRDGFNASVAAAPLRPAMLPTVALSSCGSTGFDATP